jgi:DNA polymerase I-like protein with 3'-5' exonuclease and polymerase domains
MRDDYGLGFWEQDIEVSSRSGGGPRPMPPIPETGWIMPDYDFSNLEGQGMISIDCETYDPELKSRGPGAVRDGYICGVSVGTERGFRRYYPTRHEMGENLDEKKVFSWLRRELRRPVPKVGANLLYDLGYFAANDIEVTGPFYDVQVADPCLDETHLSYSLESIAQRRLKEGKIENTMKDWLIRAFGETNYKSNIYRAPASVVGPYAEGDVDLPLRIFAQQKMELESAGLWDLFLMESRLIPMLLAMWRRGVQIDLVKAQSLYDRLADQQAGVIARIKDMAGVEPDIWAADSLAQMFDAAGVPYLYTEKTNKPSFRKEWLEACRHPLGRMVVEARRLDKFKGTFVQGYIIDGHVNGKIHCQFHQLRSDQGGTVSGRFSSSHPNLQNIPIRDPELGPLIRSIFIAEFGKRWWKKDWSQIEFRLAIHHAARMKLFGAQAVVDQYHNDPTTDYHKVVAEIAGIIRAAAKNLNFGIIYGLGIEAMADTLGVDIATATRMYRDYLKRVPFIGRLRNAAMDSASRTGIITTLSGRVRHFNVWEKGGVYYPHRIPGSKRAFTHKALNARLQGDAADIMKKAMVEAWDAGVFDYIGAPHLTVHDELDGSDDDSPASNQALAELKHIMENCVQLLVPLKADDKVGPNWGECE